MQAELNLNQQLVDAAQGMETMRRLIASGQCASLTVTGHSMAPLLRHLKDGVTVTNLTYWPPRVNDIIFCQRLNGKPVMHRVFRVDKQADQYVVWINGDAQTWEEPVLKEQVIGVVSHIRRGSKIYPMTARWIKLYTFVWGALRPVRGFGFNLYRRIKRLPMGGDL